MRKLPKVITQEEFELLLKENAKSKKKSAKYYKLAMLLGFEAGMRISEIVGYKDKVPPLTKDKVNFERNTILIESGKGGKDRIVPLPKRVNSVAIKLLPLPISRRSIQHYITQLGLKVLDRNITFHTLRHGFGSHLINAGRPIHEVQALMGHSRLDTTGIYLHANPKQAVDGAREVF